MDELDLRLVECFRAVFPDLSDDQIQKIERSEDDGWDSMASLTLLAVLEEEFNCHLDDADVEFLDSFGAARRAVERASG